MDRLLSVKELAGALGRSERYIWYLRACGFQMPGGRASLREAKEFLLTCPHPCRNKSGKKLKK